MRSLRSLEPSKTLRRALLDCENTVIAVVKARFFAVGSVG